MNDRRALWNDHELLGTDVANDLLSAMVECANETWRGDTDAKNRSIRWSDLKRAYGRRHAATYRKNPANLLKIRAIAHNRRSAKGVITAADIDAQYLSQKGRCWWCGKQLKDSYHVDHVIALSRGGTNEPKNIVISCPRCNHTKGAKTPAEFMGRLL